MKKNKTKRNTLKRRVSLLGLSVVTLCVAIFSVVQFYMMDDIFALATKLMLLSAADEIAAIDFENPQSLPEISDFETRMNIYIEIFSENDSLIYTTDGNNYIYNPNEENKAALKARSMKILSHSDRDDDSYFEMREEVYATARYIVYGTTFDNGMSLLIYYPVDNIIKSSETASIVLFMLSIIALCFYYGFTYIFAVAFTKPVTAICTTAKKIADLDFSQSCPRFRLTELDELSQSINILSSSLEQALNDLKTKNFNLERDIEKERSLEKTRQSFVANASHELKTPIAIIQGYAEGLKYGIGSTEESCDIIIEESNKMNQLIIKLLEFLHIGSGEYPLAPQDFYLDELLISHLDSLKNIFKENEINLTSNISDNLHAHGDPTLLRIVFNNYLSNAISHIANERNIHVNVTAEENHYKITVFNSGENIHEGDIENIWQSFYRADKAHSRAEGRFGLGLSLVASVQELHGEEYGVRNTENGVEFFFTVKKIP